MKTHPYNHDDGEKSTITGCLILLAIVLAIVVLFTGCTLTVAPDGTRTWGIDGEQAARAIIIYSK